MYYDMQDDKDKILHLISIGVIPNYTPQEAKDQHEKIVYDVTGNKLHTGSYFFSNNPALFYAWKTVYTYGDMLMWTVEENCTDPTGIMRYHMLLSQYYSKSLEYYHAQNQKNAQKTTAHRNLRNWNNYH